LGDLMQCLSLGLGSWEWGIDGSFGRHGYLGPYLSMGLDALSGRVVVYFRDHRYRSVM
jgi:hypothetical protein